MAEQQKVDHIPLNPEGTVGVAVYDGSYEDTRSAESIVSAVQEYLDRSGLVTSPMPYKSMGSLAGDLVPAIVTGVATEVLIYAFVRTRNFFKNWRERRLDLQLSEHRRECYVQLGDRRGENRDAIELLQMLPGLREHLLQAYPNRTYSFIVFSALPTIKVVQVILTDYELIDRTVRRIAKVISRLPPTDFAGFYLEPGPFGSRRILFEVT